MRLIEHPDSERLAAQVAARLSAACREALAERGSAWLSLAGGSTPLPIYRRLAGEDLDWRRINLIPGDDRWVACEHPASNRRALAECFKSTPAQILPIVPDEPGPEPDAGLARRTLAALEGDFDACLLGMGADGHFASLFPGAAGLADALDPDCADDAVVIRPDPLPADAPYPRISLTLRRLVACRNLMLVVRGDEKRAVLERAANGADLPITAVLEHAGSSLHIHWSP